ncbi:hypothetical protein Esti_004022 [Eimeria stiedai]
MSPCCVQLHSFSLRAGSKDKESVFLPLSSRRLENPGRMRATPRQLTLQELRRKHLGSLNGGGSSLKLEKEKPETLGGNKRLVSSSAVSKSGSISKAQRATKVKSRNNCKTPQEFSCRVKASPRGALVVPEGELKGPLLISACPATPAAAAASPEVEAYRAAVAAYQLNRIRGGAKHRSASGRSRDPRFSDLCGELNVASCSKAYSFVDEQQQQLKQQLQRIVKTGRVPKSEAAGSSKGRRATPLEREQAVKQLQSMESQQQQRERRAAAAALKASLSRAERERIAATGKRPHYVSKKKFRDLLREQQQSSSNKLNDKREARQRRKALAKERKRNIVPQRRDRSQTLTA